MLLLMVIAILVNYVGYLLEMNADTQELALQAVKVSYCGKPFIMLCMLLFTMEYCGIQISGVLRYILIFLHASVTFLVFTCESHKLFYSSIRFSQEGIFPHLVLGHGPCYMMYMGMVVMYLVVTLVVCIRRYRHVTSRVEKFHIRSFLYMACTVAGTLVLFQMGVTGGYDATLTGYLIGTLILMHMMFRYRLFDMLDAAKDDAMDYIKDGIVVVNDKEEFLYANRQALEIYPDLKKRSRKPLEEIRRLYECGQHLAVGERLYEINCHSIVKNESSYGNTYMLYDVTDSYGYTERLRREVADQTEYIRVIQRKVTLGLADIIEKRDDSTGGHVKRTSEVVKIFAERLIADGWGTDLEPDFLENVIAAAPMHDLGKITVPDQILCKPGPFTDEEYALMKTHAKEGAEIVSKVLNGIEDEEFIRIAVNMAHYHHEKWDGRGYPAGISGTDIPVEARIMALADVFDALVSKRCYKARMSYEEAFRIIEDSLGSHFEPELGERFLGCREELILYYNTVD